MTMPSCARAFAPCWKSCRTWKWWAKPVMAGKFENLHLKIIMKTIRFELRCRFPQLLGQQAGGAFLFCSWFFAVALTTSIPYPATAQNAYIQSNLVSDIPGLAAVTDTNLVNPWGSPLARPVRSGWQTMA